MAQVIGGTPHRLQIDGVELDPVDNSWTVNAAFRKKTVVATTDTETYLEETPKPGMIKGQVKATTSLDKKRIINAREVEVLIELASGEIYQGASMAYVGEGETDAASGDFAIEMVGDLEQTA